MHSVTVYSGTHKIGECCAETPKAAWQLAIAFVRGRAGAEGTEGGSGWYRTANRCGYERGAYRATDTLASTQAGAPFCVVP